MNRRFLEGLWHLADPKISITSLAAMTIGGSVAARDSEVAWGWHTLMLLALFCMEVAKNAWGDVYDYDYGTDLAVAPEDRTAFSGGKRVMVDNLLSRGQTWGIAFAFGTVGILLGAVIVILREPAVFWIGMAGLAIGWSYHGPPLKLVYRGLGELAVVLCYGPAIAVSTYMIQTHHFNLDVFWLSLSLGIFVAAFLWVNEFPDHDADARANKRNLIVRMGKYRASRLLPSIYLAGFALLAAAPFVAGVPRSAWIGFIAVPFALYAAAWTWREPEDFYRRRAVQSAALLTFVFFSAGAGAGVVIGGS